MTLEIMEYRKAGGTSILAAAVTPGRAAERGAPSCPAFQLSAHTYIGKYLAHLDEAEMTANRNGASNDAKADAAVRFAAKVARQRGHVDESDLTAVKSVGYTDAQVIEIVLHVALNTWTNYFNEVFATDIDFPVVEARRAT